MKERYWTEEVRKLQEENKRLTDMLVEAKVYEGRWFELKDTTAIIVDETFEDVLTEKELEKIARG